MVAANLTQYLNEQADELVRLDRRLKAATLVRNFILLFLADPFRFFNKKLTRIRDELQRLDNSSYVTIQQNQCFDKGPRCPEMPVKKVLQLEGKCVQLQGLAKPTDFSTGDDVPLAARPLPKFNHLIDFGSIHIPRRRRSSVLLKLSTKEAVEIPQQNAKEEPTAGSSISKPPRPTRIDSFRPTKSSMPQRIYDESYDDEIDEEVEYKSESGSEGELDADQVVFHSEDETMDVMDV